jgi:hypothetical protein
VWGWGVGSVGWGGMLANIGAYRRRVCPRYHVSTRARAYIHPSIHPSIHRPPRTTSSNNHHCIAIAPVVRALPTHKKIPIPTPHIVHPIHTQTTPQNKQTNKHTHTHTHKPTNSGALHVERRPPPCISSHTHPPLPHTHIYTFTYTKTPTNTHTHTHTNPQTVARFTWNVVPIAVSLTSFAVYVLMGNELTAATAFTSIALFNVLRFPLAMFPQVRVERRKRTDGWMDGWLSCDVTCVCVCREEFSHKWKLIMRLFPTCVTAAVCLTPQLKHTDTAPPTHTHTHTLDTKPNI